MALHGDNHYLQRIAAYYGECAIKKVTFTGAAGLGATGTVNLFNAVGNSLVAIVAVCSTDLAGATATLKVGTAASTAKYNAQVTATNIVAGDTVDVTGEVSAGTAPVKTPNQALNDTVTVIGTVATANITAGVMTYYCFWTPLDKNASVTAA